MASYRFERSLCVWICQLAFFKTLCLMKEVSVRDPPASKSLGRNTQRRLWSKKHPEQTSFLSVKYRHLKVSPLWRDRRSLRITENGRMDHLEWCLKKLSLRSKESSYKAVGIVLRDRLRRPGLQNARLLFLHNPVSVRDSSSDCNQKNWNSTSNAWSRTPQTQTLPAAKNAKKSACR